MYFVLAELIANAYDADNVYVYIDEDEIRVEDDGNGMTEKELRDQYLVIGRESRTCLDNTITNKKRMKMGRKGVGKLAALSISNGFKLVTIKAGKRIGLFIPNRIENDNQSLKELDENEYLIKKLG